MGTVNTGYWNNTGSAQGGSILVDAQPHVGNIRAQVNEAHEVTEGLIKSFEGLRTRLKPGLCPSIIADVAGPVPSDFVGSPVAQELWQIVHQLILLRKDVDDLRDLVDL